jgi:hypothetical protein
MIRIINRIPLLRLSRRNFNHNYDVDEHGRPIHKRRRKESDTHYDILGVAKFATQDEIKRKYRHLAKIYHPDSPTGSEEKFIKLQEAYSILGDLSKRTAYDIGQQKIEVNRTRLNNEDLKSKREKSFMKISEKADFINIHEKVPSSAIGMEIILGMSNPVLSSSMLGKVIPFLTLGNIFIYCSILHWGLLDELINHWHLYIETWTQLKSGGTPLLVHQMQSVQNMATIFMLALWGTQQKYYYYLFKQLNNPVFIAYSIAYDEQKDILCLVLGDSSTFFRNFRPKTMYITIENASNIDFNLFEDQVIQGMK